MKRMICASFGYYHPKNKYAEKAQISEIADVLEDMVSSGEYGDIDLDIASQMYMEWVESQVQVAMQQLEGRQ